MAEAKQSGLLSRADVHEFVRALTAEMQTAGFHERLREAVARGPVPTNDMELIAVVESVQREFIAKQYKEKHSNDDNNTTNNNDNNNNNNNNNNDNNKTVDGMAIMKELQQAVLHFPDKETESLIRNMCMVQESQMLALCAAAPELSELVKQKQQQQQQQFLQQQQQQQQHGHSHQHGPNCQHGHSHGMPNPQQMMEMQMAVQSLSPQLREDMMRIQQRMQTGQPPSGEDAVKMREIQNHIMAFMTTMRQFANNPMLNKTEGNAGKK